MKQYFRILIPREREREKIRNFFRSINIPNYHPVLTREKKKKGKKEKNTRRVNFTILNIFALRGKYLQRSLPSPFSPSPAPPLDHATDRYFIIKDFNQTGNPPPPPLSIVEALSRSMVVHNICTGESTGTYCRLYLSRNQSRSADLEIGQKGV